MRFNNSQSIDLVIPLTIIAAALSTSLIFWLDIQSPIRAVITFVFLLVGPGLAYIRLMFVRDFLTELVFSIALSIAIDTLISEILVLTAHWSTELALSIVVVLSIVGAFLQLLSLVFKERRKS